MEEKQQGLHVAVVGATGAVGQQMMKTLETRNFPIKKLTLLSSARSAGKKLEFNGKEVTVQEAKPESFEGVDIALFSAGGNISLQFAPEAVKRGAIVVDNTSAYRMDKNVPLVVPEVNEEDLKEHQDDPILVYCKAGHKSALACEMLSEEGFSNLYNLGQGILGFDGELE